MKKYWKFNYTPGLSYPPNWYGEGKWPIPYEKVTVLLQNDKDGYGIAYCEEKDFGKFQGDVEILDEKQTNKLLSQAINQLTADTDWKPIYFHDTLVPHDSEYAMNLVKNKLSDGVKELVEAAKPQPAISDSKLVFCPVCHVFVARIPVPNSTAVINLTCSNGHEVVTDGK